VTIARLSMLAPDRNFTLRSALIRRSHHERQVLTRRIAPVITACAAASLLFFRGLRFGPAAGASILDAIDAQGFNMGPQSCAALDAAAVCMKSTRLDRAGNAAARIGTHRDVRPIRF